MRQRNDTSDTLIVHTDPPVALAPGEEVDCPDPVVGLAVVDDDGAEGALEETTTRTRTAGRRRTTDAQEG